MPTWKVTSNHDYSPVIVETQPDWDHWLRLRIGEPSPGVSRLADLNRSQAWDLATYLLEAIRYMDA